MKILQEVGNLCLSKRKTFCGFLCDSELGVSKFFWCFLGETVQRKGLSLGGREGHTQLMPNFIVLFVI